MKIQKGDKVKMLTGKDRGRRGQVVQVFPKKNKVIVEGLNLVKKHVRSQGQKDPGGIVSAARKVDISNVQVICPKCDKPARIGCEDGVRVCKKCKSEIGRSKVKESKPAAKKEKPEKKKTRKKKSKTSKSKSKKK